MTNFTADQIALEAHINAENVKTQAWIDAAEGRWAGMMVSDPAHWAGYDIYTIAGYEHYMAASANFETIREIDGYKPSWGRYASMTVAEIEADTDAIIERENGLAAVNAAAAQKLADDMGHSLEDLKRWGVV